MEYLFDNIANETSKEIFIEYLVKCSYLEIYNENVNDLLNSNSKNLQVYKYKFIFLS